MKVLLAGLSGSLAHASRLVRVARALAERGHSCHLAGGPGFLDDDVLVAPGEFPRHSLAEPGLAQLIGGGEGPGWFERALDDDRALLERTGWDAVVFDNRRSTGVAARLAGVPSLSLTNTPLLGPHLGWSPSVESFLGLLAPVMGLDPDRIRTSPALRDKRPSDPMPLQAGPLPDPLRQALERVGLEPPGAMHLLSLGDRTAVCDHPLVHPLTAPPPGAEPVGPLLPALRVGLPAWWSALDDEGRPVVLVSFGSTGMVPARDAVLAALAGLEVQVVVTGLAAENAPPGVLAAPWLPGAAAAARADLVVCHGGSGTVYQALAAGTPVVALPGHLEQALNGLAVARLGAGLTVAARGAIGAVGPLRAMLDRALGSGQLRQRAQVLAEELDPAATPARCAELVEGL